jgi:hypothetical protein
MGDWIRLVLVKRAVPDELSQQRRAGHVAVRPTRHVIEKLQRTNLGGIAANKQTGWHASCGERCAASALLREARPAMASLPIEEAAAVEADRPTRRVRTFSSSSALAK